MMKIGTLALPLFRWLYNIRCTHVRERENINSDITTHVPSTMSKQVQINASTVSHSISFYEQKWTHFYSLHALHRF